MPLPGGPADKIGNRYEARWTVACMARILTGDYDTIRLEPPGAAGEGVEFCLRRGSACEYHQVKRKGARGGHWKLNDLGAAGVLSSFYNHLADANATCVFVSAMPADELDELADRARSSVDADEFNREFTRGEWGAKLAKLKGFWPGCSAPDLLSRLQRIRVRSIDEDNLKRLVELELQSHVNVSTLRAASDTLFVYAFDSVHQELDAIRIRRHLQSRGFERPSWISSASLVSTTLIVNDRYLAGLKAELIRGDLIHREESTSILTTLTRNPEKRGVVLTGDGGSGKSTVVYEVVNALRGFSIPHLAVRIDRLEPTQQPTEVGRQLGLPASPITVLNEVAGRGPCVLILDQLDAVSLMSGRNPTFFDCCDEMIHQALALPAMRILIACRRFDFQNDYRLRRLGGAKDTFDTVELGPISEATVRQVAKAIGLDETRLSADQIRLLSMPAHLKLLSELFDTQASRDPAFQTANDLYHLFWQRKEQLLLQRVGRRIQWIPIIDALCDYMNSHETLSAPMSCLDNHAPDASAMISEHVLVQDGDRVAFFHEGFFDYAFARRFGARDGDLIGMLQSGEQHLFHRAQVRQILLHERHANREAYLKHVQTLLTAADIRFHIKQVVFGFLKQLTDPSEAEWHILESLLLDPRCPYQRQVWGTIRTVPWFWRLDSLGVLSTWLSMDDCARVDEAVMLLSVAQQRAADRVAELVSPYVGISDTWRYRHRYLVQSADLAVGSEFFALVLRLLERGDLDGVGLSPDHDFLELLHDLPEQCPERSCQAIGHYIKRCLQISIASGQANPFENDGCKRHSQWSQSVFLASAHARPAVFVDHVLPCILETIELNLLRENEPPWLDTVWGRRERDDGYRIADHLLIATEQALRTLASQDPQTFACISSRLRQSEYETVRFLLTRAYAAAGIQFADEAIDHLCKFSTDLSCGYRNAPEEASRELIEAVTPYCSPQRLARLESHLLGYFPQWERTARGLRWRGSAQFKLLSAIHEPRQSDSVRSRLGEWRRKFRADPPVAKRSNVEFRMVGSPIAESAIGKLSDAQWLRAINRHQYDHGDWTVGQEIRGGAHELSQLLEVKVKQNPVRFARLLSRFPDNANDAYFSAVLRGFEGGVADLESLFQACRRCVQLKRRSVSIALCRLIERLPHLAWPGDLLDALAWYATEDADPDRELWRLETPGGQTYWGGDIRTAGINSVRGVAAGAISALLFSKRDYVSRFLPTISRMVRDQSIAVRSCVAATLLPLLNHDRNLAVQKFIELCHAEDELLRTAYIEEFMQYATDTHLDQLRPLIDRMLTSRDPEVARAGGRRAAIAYLALKEGSPLVERAISSSENARLGATEVLATHMRHPRFRCECQLRLARLFDDPNEKVRETAAQCFHGLEGDALSHLTSLIEAFKHSAAFMEHHQHLIRALEISTAPLLATTVDICRRFIEIAGDSISNIRTRASFESNRVGRLLIRTYHQATKASLRTQCLDLIDQLLSAGSYDIQRTIDERNQ